MRWHQRRVQYRGVPVTIRWFELPEEHRPWRIFVAGYLGPNGVWHDFPDTPFYTVETAAAFALARVAEAMDDGPAVPEQKPTHT
jgi:hypothetical protein